MKQPLTRARGTTGSEQVSHLDDVDLYPKPRLLSPRILGIFSAIAFTALGAALYAMGTWPWQAAAPSVAVAALQSPPPSVVPPPPVPLAQKPVEETPKESVVPVLPQPAPAEKVAPQEPLQAALQPIVTPSTPATESVLSPPTAPSPAPSSEQLAQARVLIARAEKIMAETQDIAAARLFLERAANLGEPRATFILAQTYDPSALRERGVRGIAGDIARARSLYETALAQGVSAARERLANLR